MPDSDRRSSDDLIREANERLRAEQSEPEQAPPGNERDGLAASAPTDSNLDPVEAVRPPVTEPPSTPHEPRPTEPPPSGPVEEPRKRKLPWLIWGLVALVAVGAFFFNSLNGASRDDSGEIVGAGDLDVMAMQVGDCFNDPEDLEEVLYDVDAVPCSEAHDNEVFAIESVGGAFPSDDFPGQTELQGHAYEFCSGTVFDSYVGTAYLESALDVFSITPTSESWEEGDREIVCALYRLDLAKLTDSARDSGL